LLRAVDSIGANIAESIGRGHYKESIHFLYYARGSLTETVHWIRTAERRPLIPTTTSEELLDSCVILHKQINAFIRAQTPGNNQVAEEEPPYG